MNDPGLPERDRRAELSVDAAEELVKAAELHAQGALSDEQVAAVWDRLLRPAERPRRCPE